MSSTTWGYQAGDTDVFALHLRLVSDDEDDHMVDADERASWGAFSLWVNGANLCAHEEQGETLTAAHWYLLPLLEWLVASWDPLLHEGRLPYERLSNDAAAAAVEAGRMTVGRDGSTDWEQEERVYAWRQRHWLRAASSGGLFPDVWMRRVRDELEISVGASVDPGTPGHFRFSVQGERGLTFQYLVPVGPAAEALFDAVEAATAQLLRRRPASERYQALAIGVASLRDGKGRQRDRFLWLTGHDPGSDGLGDLVKAVEEVFAPATAEQRIAALGPEEDDQIILRDSKVATLFGSVSPTLDSQDFAALAGLVLAATQRPKSSDPDVDTVMLEEPDPALRPGEAGSDLGEDAYDELAAGRHDTEGYVDVAVVLEELSVQMTPVTLSDVDLRGISLLIDGRAPLIAINTAYRHGGPANPRVTRFTLAHELAHLLLDREGGAELAIGSGPWAPRAVEQRANAFAAAFLMPRGLVLAALSGVDGPPSDEQVVRHVAGKLEVSVATLADRLHNLGFVTREDADMLKGMRRH